MFDPPKAVLFETENFDHIIAHVNSNRGPALPIDHHFLTRVKKHYDPEPRVVILFFRPMNGHSTYRIIKRTWFDKTYSAIEEFSATEPFSVKHA